MESSSKTHKKKGGCQGCALKTLIGLLFLLLLCRIARFPPQIFGTPGDHFRAFVISPIPERVTILDVDVNDEIIVPDVVYSFRFTVNRADLEKIIAENSLKPATECTDPSPEPEWWNVPSDDVEVYHSEGPGDVKIMLCYHVNSGVADYSFMTY